MISHIERIGDLIAEVFSDDDVELLCKHYLKSPDLFEGKSKAEQINILIDYCQVKYLILDLAMVVREVAPVQFRSFVGSSFEWRYGDLSRIKPRAGSVLLDVIAFRRALELLRGKIYEKHEEKILAFACLMQLIDSIVLHEHIFVLDIPISNVIQATGLEVALDIFFTLPKSATVEKELLNLPVKEGTKSFFLHPTDPAYSILSASKVGLPYRPNSVASLQTQWDIQNATKSYYSNAADQIFDQVQTKTTYEIEEMNKWLGENRFKVETPLIFNYILKEKGFSTTSLVTTALRIRESKEATAFRNFCAEFDQAARVGDHKGLYRMKQEVEKAVERLNRKYQQPTIEFGIEFPLSISLKPLEIWRAVSDKRKYHLIFIDRLYEASVRSEGLRRAFFKEY